MRHFITLIENLEKYFKSFQYHYLNDNIFRTTIGQTIADKIFEKAKQTIHDLDSDGDSEQAYQFNKEVITPIRIYLTSLTQGITDRRHNLTEWFNLKNLSLDQILTLAKQYYKQQYKPYDSNEEEDNDDDFPEEFNEKIGFCVYHEQMDHFHFMRFGQIPKTGRSIFGLAGEDNEDGPDEWRTETGNKTHEAGISVLQVHRNDNDPQGWILQTPNFAHARYGIQNFDDYLLTILPMKQLYIWKKNPTHSVAFHIEGSIVTINMPINKKKSIQMAELGSDGEFLINPKKPMKITPVNPEHVYLSSNIKLLDFLNSKHYFEKDWEDLQ